MALKTIRLLLVSLIVIGLTILAATFWEDLGLGKKEAPWLAFAWMLAFGINIAGVIISFGEQKLDKRRATIGRIGHVVLILCFITMSIYSLSTLEI